MTGFTLVIYDWRLLYEVVHREQRPQCDTYIFMNYFNIDPPKEQQPSTQK